MLAIFGIMSDTKNSCTLDILRETSGGISEAGWGIAVTGDVFTCDADESFGSIFLAAFETASDTLCNGRLPLCTSRTMA
jgi:hypothetical protein